MRLARAVSVLLCLVLLWVMLGACALRRHRTVVPDSEAVCLVTPCGDTCCNDDGKVCPPCTRDLYPNGGGR